MKKQSQNIDKLPNVLTLRQACEILNCHPNTLRNWDNKGMLKAIRFGSRGDRRYRRKDIFKIISNKKWSHIDYNANVLPKIRGI